MLRNTFALTSLSKNPKHDQNYQPCERQPPARDESGAPEPLRIDQRAAGVEIVGGVGQLGSLFKVMWTIVSFGWGFDHPCAGGVPWRIFA